MLFRSGGGEPLVTTVSTALDPQEGGIRDVLIVGHLDEAIMVYGYRVAVSGSQRPAARSIKHIFPYLQ